MMASDRLQWIAAVIADKGMPGAAVRVAGVLGFMMNSKTGQLNPSAMTIANKSTLTDRAVRGSLSKLISAGYLEVTGNRGGRGKTNNYALKNPENPESEFPVIEDDNEQEFTESGFTEREFTEREFTESESKTLNAGSGNKQETLNHSSENPEQAFQKTLNGRSPRSRYKRTREGRKTMPGRTRQTDLNADAKSILEYLNEKAGKSFRAVDSNLKLINARLKEGNSLQDLKAVVDRKVAEWAGDPMMAQYLRPATLFSATKCAQYVGELGRPIPKHRGNGKGTQPVDDAPVLDDEEFY